MKNIIKVLLNKNLFTKAFEKEIILNCSQVGFLNN